MCSTSSDARRTGLYVRSVAAPEPHTRSKHGPRRRMMSVVTQSAHPLPGQTQPTPDSASARAQLLFESCRSLAMRISSSTLSLIVPAIVCEVRHRQAQRAACNGTPQLRSGSSLQGIAKGMLRSAVPRRSAAAAVPLSVSRCLHSAPLSPPRSPATPSADIVGADLRRHHASWPRGRSRARCALRALHHPDYARTWRIAETSRGGIWLRPSARHGARWV